MAVALAPDPTTDPLAPPKPKAPLSNPYGLKLDTAPTAPSTAPLATEYPSAPSTTGAPQNRLQLATTAADTFAKSTAPQYAADLRLATQKAAGAGNLGSGELRTTYGNLANQRALALDTEKSNLINAATTGTIADQQAAEAQRTAQYGAETGRIGTTGSLDVQKGGLQLEKEKAATAAGQGQQALDLQKQQQETQAALATAGLTGILNGTQTLAAKQAAIQNAIDQGRLSNEQGQLALQQLAQSQSNTIENKKLELATAAQDIQSKVALGQLSIAQASQALDEKVKTGELTVDQAKLALDKINSEASNKVNAQNANTATAAQQAQAADAAGRLKLAQDQLDQTGKQFGLTLAQNKDLATLADKTQNRQIDVSSAQGQTSLALELARIMGAKDLNSIDPKFLAAIAKALGFAQTPADTTTPVVVPPAGKKVGPDGQIVDDGTDGGTG